MPKEVAGPFSTAINVAHFQGLLEIIAADIGTTWENIVDFDLSLYDVSKP